MSVEQSVVVGVMALVAVLSGVACWWFGTQYGKRRTWGVVALVLLTGFVFLVSVLWGSVYYVSAMACRSLEFEGVIEGLTVPVLAVSMVGLLGTGLVFVLIVRRGVGSED